ncbi:MAG: hypothetical protein LBM73_03945, partial [Candidatus Nomurabacteria bacterium]|nr:hypothetical protein [Candidatus Nomurabacteria bacterium]
NSGDLSDFSAGKLAGSVAAAVRAVRLPSGDADDLGRAAADYLAGQFDGLDEITTGDIRRAAADFLGNFNEDAAYFYGAQEQMI